MTTRTFSPTIFNSAQEADDQLTGKSSTYRAILVIDGKEFIVFPRSKKTSRFATITKARNALEAKTRNNSFDSRGLIVDAHDLVVFTLAL